MPVTRTDPQTGETRAWDGSSWVPMAQAGPVPASAQPPMPSVDKPAVDVGALRLIPGFSDAVNLAPNLVRGAEALPDVARGLVHHPLDTLKGFLQGSSSALTPERAGELALLTGGATLPAAAGAAGLAGIGQAGQAATGAPNAPISGPEAAWRMAGAAAIPGLPAIGGKVLGAAGSLSPKTMKTIGGSVGALTGGYEGYEHGGVPGAVLGAGSGAWGGARVGDILSNMIPASVRGLEGGAEGAAPAFGDAWKPRVSSEVPGSSYRDPFPSSSPAQEPPGWYRSSSSPEDEILARLTDSQPSGTATTSSGPSAPLPEVGTPGQSIAERAAAMRVENPNIDTEAAAMRARAATTPSPSETVAAQQSLRGLGPSSASPSYMQEEPNTELVNAGGDAPVRARLTRDARPNPFATIYGPDGQPLVPSLDDQYRQATYGLRAPYGAQSR